MHDDDAPVADFCEVLTALEAVVNAAEPAKREAFAAAMDTYHEEFHWVTNAQSPTLLHHLFSLGRRRLQAKRAIHRGLRSARWRTRSLIDKLAG